MWTYNMFEALRRLGVKDARQPDLIRDQVMQAIVVGDVSKLAFPVQPATALYGGERAGVLVQYGGFSIQSLSPGGSFLDCWGMTTTNASGVTFAVTASEYATNLNTAVTGFDLVGGYAVPDVVLVGTEGAVGPSGAWPTIGLAANVPMVFSHPIYIRPGYWFTALCQTSNQAIEWFAMLRSVPAREGSA